MWYRKVADSNPCKSGGIIFFSKVDFLCWLLFRCRGGSSFKLKTIRTYRMLNFSGLVPLRITRTCGTHDFRRLVALRTIRTCVTHDVRGLISLRTIRTCGMHDFRRLVPLRILHTSRTHDIRRLVPLRTIHTCRTHDFRRLFQKASSFKNMCACRTHDFRRLVPLKTILTWGAAGTRVLQCRGADLGTTPPRRAGLRGDQRVCELMTCCWWFGWGTACHVIASDTPFLFGLPVAWRDVSVSSLFKKSKEKQS